MKATVINETTFRLFSAKLSGFDGIKGVSTHLGTWWCSEKFPDEVVDWMREYTPGFRPHTEEHMNLDDQTMTLELFLQFKTPADACAFRLRWL